MTAQIERATAITITTTLLPAHPYTTVTAYFVIILSNIICRFAFTAANQSYLLSVSITSLPLRRMIFIEELVPIPAPTYLVPSIRPVTLFSSCVYDVLSLRQPAWHCIRIVRPSDYVCVARRNSVCLSVCLSVCMSVSLCLSPLFPSPYIFDHRPQNCARICAQVFISFRPYVCFNIFSH